jgi:hypothetical protein
VNSFENFFKLCNVYQSLSTYGLKCEWSLDYVIAGSVDPNAAQTMDIPVCFSIFSYEGRGLMMA